MARKAKPLAAWQQLAQLEKKRRDETIGYSDSGLPDISIPRNSSCMSIPSQVLSPIELTITESPIETLLASLASGQLSAIVVLTAFMQRARIAHRLTNCITEFLPERAVTRAQWLDNYWAENKKPIGPLHGLPFSVKEQLSIKDLDVTASFVGWLGQKAPSDAACVQLLEQQGGIAFARTTQPQGLSMLETVSNLYGTTTNPHNTTLTPGGSSGGDAALIALKGSPLGVGGDVGGSIRVPASHCGLYGFRPSTFRVPLTGLKSHCDGCETIFPAIGPLAPTLEGIRIFMESIVGAKPWESDASAHSVAWRDGDAANWLEKRLANKDKIRIGVIWDDGVVKPLPPVLRALTEVVTRMELVGEIEVVEFKQNSQTAHRLYTKLLSVDAGAKFQETLDLSGEPWLPLASWANREGPGIEKLDIHGVWEATRQRDVFRQEFFEKWKASGVDVVLAPVAPSTATAHDQKLSRYWGYSSLWNLVDYPSLSFPVTRLNPAKDDKDNEFTPRNDDETWAHGSYDVDKQMNAPVGLQLVGPRMADEKVLAIFGWLKEKTGLPFEDCLNA